MTVNDRHTPSLLLRSAASATYCARQRVPRVLVDEVFKRGGRHNSRLANSTFSCDFRRRNGCIHSRTPEARRGVNGVFSVETRRPIRRRSNAMRRPFVAHHTLRESLTQRHRCDTFESAANPIRHDAQPGYVEERITDYDH